jgi:valyl-tRNA synthetase
LPYAVRSIPMLSKSFSPAEAEAAIYQGWEQSGAFSAQPGSNADPFTIMIPPPNVTGSLHVGHALTMTLQDVLTRWRRMQGRDALWQPGTDHAGIATQMVVERLLGAEGTSRQAIGREGFTDRVWQWKEQSGGAITTQLRRLGASLDWPRERFTMDAGLSDAVREVFVTLHQQGLIYRDRRLVNWDPAFQSAISDLEVESREVKGSLWHIAYAVEGGSTITVATTRPETLLGDTAIAVHPDDARYAGVVGKFAIVPLVGRRIPIVADTYSDPEKGTGAVKITPAHDFNDFEVGRRHGLPMPTVLDREGRVTLEEIEAASPFVQGLAGQDRFAARKAIVAELERLEILVLVQPHVNQVPHADRSGAVVEPRLTTQWYCNVGAMAQPAIAAVEAGETVFVPKQWENTFFAWMRDIQPWCISRQLWWGHRIPAWFGPDEAVFVARTEAEAQAAARAHYGRDEPLTQDEDVLDTWFSSALWPFSTLGWPKRTADLARYYPTDVLVTGFDIIFFWVARMMMMGLHFMGEVPFRTVYINALVRDERGQKMSKSKGNVVDPLELIDTYGADALRWTVCALAGPGRDVKLGAARVELSRSFVTKLWNAARFCEMNEVRPDPAFDPAAVQAPLCRWILDAANIAAAEATAALEAFRFDEYAAASQRFTWNVFCDWFLEFAKPVFLAGGPEAVELRATTAHVLGIVLRLLHPAMPFVTEAVWDEFGYGARGSLIRAEWPVPAALDAAEARTELDWLVRLIGEVRTVRAEMNVAPSILTPILLRDADAATLERAGRWSDAIRRMARASEVAVFDDSKVLRYAAQIPLGEATLVLPLEGLIDIEAERNRLQREIAKAEAEQAKVAAKLGNSDFVARAPPEIVEEMHERKTHFTSEIARRQVALSRIR